MSPRRMDISSLLRDPSPPPRSSSLLSILNSPRPPYLGLDALVHVAAEERRRISAADNDSHKRPSTPPSPSPSINYPTLRPQPVLHIDPSRPVSDLRTIAHPSPFIHPSHSSPRNTSPRRHSPHLHRSQHHSSPSAESDMSPRYGHGPRMAGGIQVLSNDPPRPDFAIYQSPGRDMPPNHLFLDAQHSEHPRYEPPRLSPLSCRPFSLDDDRHRVKPPSHLLEDQESLLPRGSRLPYVSMEKQLDQPPLERHPIRVWEDHPSPREISRHVSPVRMPTSTLVEGYLWSKSTESEDDGPPTQHHSMALPQHVVENVHASPLSTYKEPSPLREPTTEPLTRLRTPAEGIRFDSRPSVLNPLQYDPLAHPARTSLPWSSTAPPSASPVVDLHLKTPETQPEPPDTYMDAGTSVPPVSSDPIVPDPVLDYAELRGTVDPHTSFIVDPPPKKSPLIQQQPLPVLLPAQDEYDTPSGDILLPQPSWPEPKSHQSPEPKLTTAREPPVPEQVMMDVDEELLGLVEDRPTHVVPAMSTTRPLAADQITITDADAEQASSGAPGGPSSVPSVFKGPLVTDEEKDRASMPPPAARHRKAEKDKSTATGSKKKKDGSSKPSAKPKPPPKPRAKATPKPKPRPNVADASLKAGVPKGAVNVNARSRSTSVIPGTVDDVVPELDADDKDKEDGKLYCVCKTRYDEDRMMIACDRCDEWFHTLCVDMPDLEIDLVDQFICPPCVQKHPHLETTWKRRCLFGLQHEDPSSSEACHKPSRGMFSKYCSDDCGIKYMQARIVQWEKSGGSRDLLWESVKNATKREGVVVYAMTNRTSHRMDVDGDNSGTKPLNSAAKRRAEREVARLNTSLDQVVKERELMKRELDMVMWREKVVELASGRAGKVDECGWDQRLCFGEEEWVDFGLEVLESYEEERVKVESGEDALHGEWWCTGKKKCERHAGWQKLRAAEVSFDKETKEGILLKLTTREREIRKRIEDILYPQPTSTLQPALCPEVQLNGASERGKKKPS